MDWVGIAFEAGVIITSAFVAALAGYLAFGRNPNVALWSYLSAFIPRAIIVLLVLLGASNLGIVTWLSHTVGIFVYPMLLTMGNILLIEVALARKVGRKSSMPLNLKQALRIERFLRRLQDRKLLPKAVSVKEVYLAGVMAGVINLAFVVFFGLLPAI